MSSEFSNSSCIIIFISMFVMSPFRTHLCVILLCSSQYAMSEFIAFFSNFRFFWSRCGEINDSILGVYPSILVPLPSILNSPSCGCLFVLCTACDYGSSSMLCLIPLI